MTEDAVFIIAIMFYDHKNLASLLRKKDMEELDGFREFLKEKFGDRYRILW